MFKFHDYLPSRRLTFLLLALGFLPVLLANSLVSGEDLEKTNFLRLNYAPFEGSTGNEDGGKFIITFAGRVKGKMRQEVGLPLFYMDILGASLDMSPLITPFPNGPAKIVRLTQISSAPPVVRATFFLRSLFAYKMKNLDDGIEIVFQKNLPDQTPEKPVEKPDNRVPFPLLTPENPPATNLATSSVVIEMKAAESGNLLRELARQAGMNVHFRDPLDSTIDISATASNPLEAMNTIVSRLGGTLSVEDGEIWISSKNNPLLSFSDSDYVEGADLRGLGLGDVLRALGQLGQLNVVLDPSLEPIKERPVDIVLQRMSYRQVFDTLVRLHDLALRPIDSKTILVLTRKEALKSSESTIRVVNMQSDLKKTLEIIKSTISPSDLEQLTIKEDQGNLILVGEKEIVNRAQLLIETVEGKLKRAGEGVTREFFRAVNTKTDDLIKMVGESLGEGNGPRITKDDRTDTLVISGPKEVVARAKHLLQELDRSPTAQALIHIRLVEINRKDLKNFGLKLSAGNIGVADIVNIGASASLAIPAALSFLESRDRAKILANPTIRCMDKEKATFDISQQIPVKNTITDYLPLTTASSTASGNVAARTSDQWTTADIGIKLDVTPTIHADGEVSLDLNVNFIELVKFIEGHPWTAKRNLTTKIRVKDRESVIIAGLIRRNNTEGKQPLPFFSKIPILKRLFRPIEQRDTNVEETEMVIIFTPTIVGSTSVKSVGVSTQKGS